MLMLGGSSICERRAAIVEGQPLWRWRWRSMWRNNLADMARDVAGRRQVGKLLR
jgi:hypothetical protein